MSRRTKILAGTVGFVILVAAAGLSHVALPLASAAGSATTTTTATSYPPARVQGFYLDIGASSSLGVQATPSRAQGYSNDLVALEAARGVSLTLKEVGCPGETADSILLRGDESRIRLMQGRCYHGGPAQLAQAKAYLLTHRTQEGVVTIDIGFNDVRTCLNTSTVNQACFEKNLAVVTHDMPLVVADLKGVAGPRTHFVGLQYADPFLQHYLSGAKGKTQAALSLRDIDGLNSALASIYHAAGVAIANVPARYDSSLSTLTSLKPYGVIPENVKQVCQLTWMCVSEHNDHANAQGYAQVAHAILRALPPL